MAEEVPHGRVTQRPSPVRDVHIVWMTAGRAVTAIPFR